MGAEQDQTTSPTLGIIGGTGALGSALAWRWAAVGHKVVLGSRSAARAGELADAVKLKAPNATISGSDNVGAARNADILVITVPYGTQTTVLAEIAEHARGKIILHTVVPLHAPKVTTVRVPPGGSAAQEAQTLLGDSVRVVSALHNVSATKLIEAGPVDCDVLVFGNDSSARSAVIRLIEMIELRAIDGGVLANSVAAEALTAVLIGINRRNKIKSAGIRITGLPQPAG